MFHVTVLVCDNLTIPSYLSSGCQGKCVEIQVNCDDVPNVASSLES